MFKNSIIKILENKDRNERNDITMYSLIYLIINIFFQLKMV